MIALKIKHCYQIYVELMRTFRKNILGIEFKSKTCLSAIQTTKNADDKTAVQEVRGVYQDDICLR